MIFEYNEHACKVSRDAHAKRVEDIEKDIESLELILGDSLSQQEIETHVAELDRLRREREASENKIKEMDDHLKSLKHES